MKKEGIFFWRNKLENEHFCTKFYNSKFKQPLTLNLSKLFFNTKFEQVLGSQVKLGLSEKGVSLFSNRKWPRLLFGFQQVAETCLCDH